MSNQSHTRTPIGRMLDAVTWEPCEPPSDIADGVLYATHTGSLTIGTTVLDCAVLSDGTRIFTEESILRAFGSDASVGSVFKLLTGEDLHEED